MTEGTKSTGKVARPQKATSGPVKFYLVAYNALSAAGWAYVLALIVIHVFNLDGQSPSGVLEQPKATGLFSRLPLLKNATGGTIYANLPEWLKPVYARATTAHARAGFVTTFVQSFAVLEVVHAALGWVRSPVATTAMQVASRLWLVWGILDQFPSVHTNPLFASMVFAWSFTEVIRYTFYAFNLLGYNPRFLLWLRYTTFYILYPIGAGSEAFLMFATLPLESSPIESLKAGGTWTLADYGRGVLFAIWWPGLYVMYTYMIKQRRKVFGPAKGPKSKRA
ncbi:hypothetical protein D9611_000213 [Ephemerocybe angulata]|uniref:Very-long-chain (3R)-3-hydroxyacyl-CoA dehydratase n=1 Tax=Ephemerocybe angulata TaxID=980116 RepID=A0A8H5BNH5_9AGAR|nr:hypothetical protein D9611_000213 [Tulosesus angulatus]